MLTRLIYPLTLREKISWKVKRFYDNVNDTNISLEFDKALKFDLSKRDVGHQSIIFNGFYELALTKTIIRLAKKGGTMLDVGANYGYFSCLWASLNPKNKVFAFEASPENIGPLRNNIAKNRFSNAIDIIPIAIGKEAGKLKFDLGNDNHQTGWGGLSIANNSSSVEVDVDTLDNFSMKNNVDHIEVLKIDTEGADTWVLYGAKKLLKEKRIAHLFFEHNPSRMKLLNIREDEAKKFLEDLDYVVEQQSASDFYARPKK